MVAAAFWIPTGTCGSGRKKQCCAEDMHDFRSHFWWDFLAYCTRPVSVHLAMACVGCSFDSFSVFLLSLKQQQNLIKMMFSCIHFPVCPYLSKIMIFYLFYTGKLYGLTGMFVFSLPGVFSSFPGILVSMVEFSDLFQSDLIFCRHEFGLLQTPLKVFWNDKRNKE